MIVVDLKGGLGNQMFQYAAGLSLAQKSHSVLKLSTSRLDNDAKRDFVLDQWSVKPGVISEWLVRVRFPALDQNKGVGLLLSHMGLLGRVYREPGFQFDPELADLSPPVLLDGYWQSYHYMEGIETMLRTQFQPSGIWPKNFSEYLERIQKTDSVAVHIRRGDYISDPDALLMHGVCSVEYYRKALQYLFKHKSKGEVFYFSDDPEWVTDNILEEMPGTLISGTHVLNDAQELWLMSKANHHVIANSSFSWWAAWLGKKEGQCVVAPEQWFSSSDCDVSDLLLPEWVRI